MLATASYIYININIFRYIYVRVSKHYVLVYPFFVKDKIFMVFFGLLFSTEVFSTPVCLALLW